ncbi:MAG: hypothetical protein QOC92_549 [Acidimicrobiaceae bacterium]
MQTAPMAAPRRPVVLVCAALLLLPLAACSKDSKRPSAASNSSSAASSLSSSSSSSTDSAPPPTTGLCSAPEIPPSAVNVTHADGDFNGDNTTDSLTVYGTGTNTQPSPYHVRIELAESHGTVDTVIADAATDNNQTVKALGGADVSSSAGLPPDGSGAEPFVEIGSGASDSLIGVFQLIGCSLTRLTGPQGTAPSQFPIGGSVTHLDGLRCDGSAGGQRLVQLSATSSDGVSYDTKETRLEVQDGKFTATANVTDKLDARDARLQEFSTLNCPGVQTP